MPSRGVLPAARTNPAMSPASLPNLPPYLPTPALRHRRADRTAARSQKLFRRQTEVMAPSEYLHLLNPCSLDLCLPLSSYLPSLCGHPLLRSQPRRALSCRIRRVKLHKTLLPPPRWTTPASLPVTISRLRLFLPKRHLQAQRCRSRPHSPLQYLRLVQPKPGCHRTHKTWR